MKKLLYPLALMAAFAIVFVSCEKQDATAPQNEDVVYKAKKPKVKLDVCHLDDEGNWIKINISQNALKAHLGHGDMVAFPNLTSYKWYFSSGGVYVHTMYIDWIENGKFGGHGVLDSNPAYTWVLEDGTYDEGGNITFTVIYTGAYAGYTWNCTGLFACGEETSGQELHCGGYLS